MCTLELHEEGDGEGGEVKPERERELERERETETLIRYCKTETNSVLPHWSMVWAFQLLASPTILCLPGRSVPNINFLNSENQVSFFLL